MSNVNFSNKPTEVFNEVALQLLSNSNKKQERYEKEAVLLAESMLENNYTIRELAKIFKMGRDKVHRRLRRTLKELDWYLYIKCDIVLRKHKEESPEAMRTVKKYKKNNLHVVKRYYNIGNEIKQCEIMERMKQKEK